MARTGRRLARATHIVLVASCLAAPLVRPTAATASTPHPTSPSVPSTPVTASTTPATSALTMLPSPIRILDTRNPGNTALSAGGERSVSITGPIGVLSGRPVSAVVVNMTVVGPAGVGHWTVWPTGEKRPEASVANVDDAARLDRDLAIPNLVTVPVTGSSISIHSHGGGHVVIDLLGYYSPTTSTAAGRFVARTAPARVYDSRGASMMRANETRNIVIPEAAGASAVALNLTAIGVAPGFWKASAPGASPSEFSNLNSIGLGHVSANQVITAVGADGSVDVYSQSGGHLIVDVVGVFTGAGATVSSDGLFVPIEPTRFLDTRRSGRLEPGWATEVPVAARLASTSVSAVAMNVTVLDALFPGYVSATTAGSAATTGSRATSTLNVVRSNQTIANHALVPVSQRGFDLFTQGGGHLLADVTGWYTGSPAPAPHGAQQNRAPSVPAGCTGPAAGPVGVTNSKSNADSVRRLQDRLMELGFWHAGSDGSYGLTTRQAVMAFQKWSRIPATADVDAYTAELLNGVVCGPVAGKPTGDYFEVNKTLQIAHVVRAGQVVYTFNVSTGNGRDYDEEDQRSGGRVVGVAITPNGTFRVYREVDDPLYEGSLGTLYRPKFVVGGVAVHGSRSIPNYPASHGCIRVANPVMDLIWSQTLLPRGGTVWIHE